VLVCRQAGSLAELPPGAAVGSGSLRRRAQLLHVRGDLQMKDMRGNVDTRLRKLDQGDYDALVLAEAGLRRLNLAARITQMLPMSIMLPAVGQGALALETRCDDQAAREAVARLDDPATHRAVLAERSMLAALQGGCLAPIAAWGRVEGDQLTLTGRVLSPDGAEKLEATHSAAADEAIPLGRRVAGDLLSQGAADLIRASRGQMGSHHENAKTRNVETAADKRRSKGDRRIY
jgi:hydroxymethylbilane synthase